MKVGDLVKIWDKADDNLGIIVTEPRVGFHTPAPDGPAGRLGHSFSAEGNLEFKVCEVLFSVTSQVATRACNDLVVINPNRGAEIGKTKKR